MACFFIPFCATNAFTVPQLCFKRICKSQLFSNIDENADDVAVSRRKIMLQGFGSLVGITSAMVMRPENAEASYSAYANREKDWEERQKNDGKEREKKRTT